MEEKTDYIFYTEYTYIYTHTYKFVIKLVIK